MKTSLRKRFGLKVKELRLASGLSQEAFADKCGFARSYMSRIERGTANPSLDAVEVLAVALDVEVARLFEGLAKESGSAQEVLVPFASDGSCFNPSLRRPSSETFCVGEKANPLYLGSFEAALEYLRSMDTAKWRRPNEKGNWGLVSAVHWAPLPSQVSEPIPQPSDDSSV